MLRLGIVALALTLEACTFVGVGQEDGRCADLDELIVDCFGVEYLSLLACADLSDTDVSSLTAVLAEGGCESFGGAIPRDGDLRASYCQLFGDGCIAGTNPRPSRQPTVYPVLLVNGIDVSPNFRYSDRIVATMEEVGGHSVHLATLRPYDAPHRRAVDLWEHIERVRTETGAAKVNLICHSLGGLDCRYLVSPGGLHHEVEADHATIAGSVASISTVSTAHHGTPAADLALGYLSDGDASEAVEHVATFFGHWFTAEALQEDTHLREALVVLSEANAPAFNRAIVDAPGVYYQSWGGVSRPYGEASAEHDAQLPDLCATRDGGDGLALFHGEHDYMDLSLVPVSEMIAAARAPTAATQIPNDGFVPIPSSRWGRFRGCVPADHMEQLGQRNLPAANVRTGFDVAWFYTNLANELSGMGY